MLKSVFPYEYISFKMKNIKKKNSKKKTLIVIIETLIET
jgi:hypothetical protein